MSLIQHIDALKVLALIRAVTPGSRSLSELTDNGVMEAGRLYESPFVDISPQGPEGLFPAAKVKRMVQVLAEIRQRAVA